MLKVKHRTECLVVVGVRSQVPCCSQGALHTWVPPRDIDLIHGVEEPGCIEYQVTSIMSIFLIY